MVRKNGKTYLTAKEYSEAAKISKQAVYQQLKSRLKDFTIELDNQAYIDAAALDKFYPEEDTSEVEQLAQVELDRVRESDTKQIEQLERMIQLQESTIEQLQRQLEAKDQQIADLSQRLAEALEGISQEQKLHLVTQNKLQLIESKQEEVEEAAEQEKKESGSLWGIFKRK